MGSVNINRNVSDVFYRYKMPKLQSKVEGKGNGIKTVIVNMVEIAKALSRPPTYPTKYFGCELGAQTLFDFKNERYIVNGSHDALKLQNLLDGFIRKFVLCTECDNPETMLCVNQKKQLIQRSCKACGHQGIVDMKHKLTTFILKNPPDINPGAAGSSLAVPSKGKNKKKGDNKNGNVNNTAEDLVGGGSPSEAEVQEHGENIGGDDDDWAEDVSQEAVMQRMKDLTNGAKNLTVSDDLEKSEKERVDIFYAFVRQHKNSETLVGHHKEILAEAERLEIKEKAPLVLTELLLNESIFTQLKQHRILFLCFTHDNLKAQKSLLGGIELLIQLHKDLLPKVSAILKTLYDNDIIDEDVLLEWGQRPSKRYINKKLATEIRTNAEPFLKWLREAEEEDSSEESDVEIDYDDRLNATSLKECNINQIPATKVAENSSSEDDLDIDAI